MTGKPASATSDRLLTMAPLERLSSGKKARHIEHSEEVDGEVLPNGVEIAQIVVESDAGIVDENVEDSTLLTAP
jgi:hypothetical protein